MRQWTIAKLFYCRTYIHTIRKYSYFYFRFVCVILVDISSNRSICMEVTTGHVPFLFDPNNPCMCSRIAQRNYLLWITWTEKRIIFILVCGERIAGDNQIADAWSNISGLVDNNYADWPNASSYDPRYDKIIIIRCSLSMWGWGLFGWWCDRRMMSQRVNSNTMRMMLSHVGRYIYVHTLEMRALYSARDWAQARDLYRFVAYVRYVHISNISSK